MELKVGKFYKTREGLKAYIAAIGSPFEDTENFCQAIGWVNDPEICNNTCRWTKDGVYGNGAVLIGPQLYDLIDEWKD